MSNPNMESKVKELMELRRMKEELEAEITTMEDEIKQVMGDEETLLAGAYKVLWKAVTTSRFGIDIHGLDKKANDVRAAGQNFGVKFRPFQIPLRACRAKDLDNLYMAGRCISGDFYAHASYRVTGSSVAIGEAVGKAISKGTQE